MLVRGPKSFELTVIFLWRKLSIHRALLIREIILKEVGRLFENPKMLTFCMFPFIGGGISRGGGSVDAVTGKSRFMTS
jgi:hypothetical protein